MKENQTNVVFDNAAIDIKTAWIDMTGVPKPERYYTRDAHVFDLPTNTCSKKTVGLVGFHIVHKTPSRPQWIWSSFEHVDTVPDGANTEPLAFNDRTGQAMPDNNPYPFPPPESTPPPFNVDRLKPIHDRTRATNERYRKALGDASTPWQFYELVMTQWPLSIGDPSKDGKPTNTFPGAGTDKTSFSNTTLETFEQQRITTGCMNCHNATRTNTDFLWSLATRAWRTPPVGPQPPSPASAAAASANAFSVKVPASTITVPIQQLDSLIELRALLESTRRKQ